MRSIDVGSRLIIGVGRNYAQHAKELNNAVPTSPILFLKPPSSRIWPGQSIRIPAGIEEVHHEVELGVVIGSRTTSRVAERDAFDYIGGFVLALDMTCRDLQAKAIKAGHPWTVAKGYDTFCPLSEFISRDQLPDPSDTRLWLTVNDVVKQDGSTKDMIFSVPALVSHCSSIFSMEPGDLILTGTPAGVGPVRRGDTLQAGLNDSVTVLFNVE
ncbi:Fumarylacetoacetase-like C-terminal domain-containing protein [Plasmodiophora brassicae]|uniref:Fumarylacetoacetase-like C-terminal domain-containing protein n=1 Tax=Plasmodiophora brassicae TaxID=37360 RepID=A0A0G4IRK9_PLABS|nr:hypothetical protein PBRA_006017 [Plasmodiophora brassicae]SPQ98121.1 unnamed protein product [Plasmodiophora brassicae]